MGDSSTARTAIFEAIEEAAKDAENYPGPQRAAMVRDVALAWRYAIGGNQPGQVVISS